jgi:hypothetical protein
MYALLLTNQPVILTYNTKWQRKRNNHRSIATACLVARSTVVEMTPDIEKMKLRVQATLDDLIGEHLIPFRLTAQNVNTIGPGKYVVPFYDSRIHSFEFSWTDGGPSLKEVVRAAVLGRVKKMDGSRNGLIP